MFLTRLRWKNLHHPTARVYRFYLPAVRYHCLPPLHLTTCVRAHHLYALPFTFVRSYDVNSSVLDMQPHL